MVRKSQRADTIGLNQLYEGTEMNLDEAVEHYRGNDDELADWLEELKVRREHDLPPHPKSTEKSVLFWRRVHNLVAHPLMEVLPDDWGDWLHEVTAKLALL